MAQSTRRVAILVEDQYQVLEVWYPLLRLKEAGLSVTVVGTGTKDVYPSKEGYPVKVDLSIAEAKASDFDGVIIPGGWAPDFLRRYPPVVDFVKKLYEEKKAVAAICHGGWLLVSADIARGNKVTCFYAIKDDLIASGGEYIDEEVVVDKNLITSRKPDDLPRFVEEIIKYIEK
ncbi:MAG: type 1 glutamine amidotransferase [Candidatus Omnitrophica bacterium]|nr:type 1 glutamine amidotransferase [Candidatus Omnitrophota bacterium]